MVSRCRLVGEGEGDANTGRLIGKDRPEEARAILVQLHVNGDANHPLVDLQMREMEADLREQGMMTWRSFFDLRVLVKTKARRYRLMLNIAFSWFGQFSGNNVASYCTLWCTFDADIAANTP